MDGTDLFLGSTVLPLGLSIRKRSPVLRAAGVDVSAVIYEQLGHLNSAIESPEKREILLAAW